MKMLNQIFQCIYIQISDNFAFIKLILNHVELGEYAFFDIFNLALPTF